MGTTNEATATHGYNRSWVWIGAALTVVGFLGHFFAARAIEGMFGNAYRDHIFGFFLILVVTGAIIAFVGRFLWKGRFDITMLTIGIVQALFGIVIYIFRYHV